PRVVRKIKLTIEGTAPIPYAVQSGPGGLILKNSTIVSNGSVYLNGTLTMSNTAQIGSSSTPVPVDVAYDSCPSPADSTYPQLCTSGQPISIINSAHIYGTVNANYQTDGSGMSNPGLTGRSGVQTSTLPSYDRNAQKQQATN